ncbi:hypothetical protein GWO43_01800 [candidate division KSB1 bacterium]|nr:hypothetical protein [candidate division KSB1 bacterium]NIR69459.1 hypothetical protein [candidate division KSB1 bacterium]NIS22808.1 hypothetical protein [candidate division KSB1 bacterium]NIT69648.1 hypothetical protein [candidate division KSB1 bacterium]NIU23317.1 hypothetical protein [candidate division KSB1 bacterium]
MPRLILIAILLASSVWGCFSRKAVQLRYYLIESPAAAEATLSREIPLTDASCEIRIVSVHPAFADNRIAVRMNTHELNYYAHHKWAVTPEETLTQLTEEYLQRRRIFATASSRVWKFAPEYQLQTRVNQLEVVQQDEKLSAHLNVEFTLIRNASKLAVAFHSADRKVPLAENDLNTFASTISDLFYKELQVLSEKITSYLQDVDVSDSAN